MTAGSSWMRLAGIGAGMLGLAALAAGLWRPDLLVEASVARALAASPQPPRITGLAANARVARAAPLVGDERFWLTHAQNDQAAMAPKLLAVGDRLSIQSAERGPSGIEIVEIRTIAASEMPAGLAEPGHEIVVVTGKLSGDSGDRRIRFILDGGLIAPAPKATIGHAAL